MNTLTRALGRTACEQDDTALLGQVISTIPEDDPERLYDYLRRNAIKNNASKALNVLAERGVDFERLWPGDIIGGDSKTNKETLKFLRAHGWNINWRDKKGQPGLAEPFMWHCVNNYDMIAWCLELGASVRPGAQEPLSKDVITLSQRQCPQILERVAMRGSVATFELLRLKGAPLGWRTLHRAVECATLASAYSPDSEKGGEIESKREERMAMVRHLIDVVKIDVNALDKPAGSSIPGYYWGTPICYIPGSLSYLLPTAGIIHLFHKVGTTVLLDTNFGADSANSLTVWYNNCTRCSDC